MKKYVNISSVVFVVLSSIALFFACSTGAAGGFEKSGRPAGYTDSRVANSILFTMRYVPSGGTFIMGENVETVTQTVTLTRNFWMGETEVTQGLWEAVWGPDWPGNSPSDDFGLGPNRPAYYISWYDAIAFCNLLTVADGRIDANEQVYYSDAALTVEYDIDNAEGNESVFVDWSKKGYRLPTEAEWEYSARYIDGIHWNHGNHVSGDTEYACYTAVGCSHELAEDERISGYAWWAGNNGEPGNHDHGTKDVGQIKANALGLRDMSGNVWEWCYDRWAEYSGLSSNDPVGPDSGNNRTDRGGSWLKSESFQRCAFRGCANPAGRGNIGFRLCRTAD